MGPQSAQKSRKHACGAKGTPRRAWLQLGSSSGKQASPRRGIVDIAGAVSDPLAMSIAPSASGEPPPPAASTASTASTTSAAAASMTASAASAASVVAAAGVVAPSAASAADKLYAGLGCPDVFLVEDIERRQGNVGNFLLTKSDFGVPGRHVHCRSSGYRGCAARHRQRQSGGPQQGYGACSTLSF
jgi:hypothetical protein